jgi:PAS domain S-box-containing protein
MTPAELPPNEAQRLEALRRYAVMDTAPETALDELTTLAAQLCGTPMALISLVDERRQWFKSRVGLSAPETPRDMAFCAHAIRGTELLTVPDAQRDTRFADNPLVTSDPHIRFYAGAPLVSPDGHSLGTLCVLDHEPRRLSPDQEAALRILSRHVMAQLERRRQADEQQRQTASGAAPAALPAPFNEAAMARVSRNVTVGFVVALALLLIMGLVSVNSIGAFRELTAELVSRQGAPADIATHLEAVDRQSRTAVRWLAAGGAFSALLLGAAFFGLRREALRRKRAEAAIRQAHESVERQVRERSTELTQANVALRESVASLSRIGDNLANGYLFQTTMTPEGKRQITYVSASVERVVGMSAEVVMADPAAAYRHILDEDRPAWLAAEQASMRNLSVFSAELRLRRPGGEITWLSLTSAPSRLPDGSIAWDGIGLDITERKQAEARVLALNQQLTQHAAELEERVAERTAALEVARHRAESADRLKSAFLASMSHELRTPLNSILGFTGVILQGLAGPINAEQAKQLDMVRVSGRHLLALINDVLDLSKIEAGEMVVDRAPLDLRATIEKVAALIQPLADKKGLALGIEVAPEVGRIEGDARRIEQVLLNLLGNAVKFTERGEVALRVDVLPAGPGGLAALRFRVCDTGIGIRAEDLSALFQPFRQLDAGLARNHEGTGLGLVICRRLADLMGGTIVAQSIWGGGSEFSFTLPFTSSLSPRALP